MLNILFVIASAAAATPVADPLQPLAFLVGACWAGEFPHGAGRDTHCFEPVYGGKFVRDKHVLHGKGPDYLGETMYWWSAPAKQIQFTYWSSDGDVESGTATPVAEGLDFPEHHLTEPKDLTMRARWRRHGNDAYQAIEEQKDGDGWKTLWTIDYQRVSASKAAAGTP